MHLSGRLPVEGSLSLQMANHAKSKGWYCSCILAFVDPTYTCNVKLMKSANTQTVVLLLNRIANLQCYTRQTYINTNFIKLTYMYYAHPHFTFPHGQVLPKTPAPTPSRTLESYHNHGFNFTIQPLNDIAYRVSWYGRKAHPRHQICCMFLSIFPLVLQPINNNLQYLYIKGNIWNMLFSGLDKWWTMKWCHILLNTFAYDSRTFWKDQKMNH